MNETDWILRLHAARYPLMEPRDAVKLLYQSEFGGGHLIQSRDAARIRLLAEYRSVSQDASPLWEELGGGMLRVHLRALDAHGVAPETLLDWFCASAAAVHGCRESFLAKLGQLSALTEEGRFSFDAAALETYLCAYAGEGYPPVSHSEAYCRAYAPAYRVVRRDCCGGLLPDGGGFSAPASPER